MVVIIWLGGVICDVCLRGFIRANALVCFRVCMSCVCFDVM